MKSGDVVYVDSSDTVIGSGSIQHAVENGIIRRVSRILIFNPQGEMLLQQRSATISYPGLWNNSASGHVDVGETYLEAAVRELEEEMGIKDTPLSEIGKFYGDEQDGAFIRKAFNTIYTGMFDGIPVIDENEVSGAEWMPVPALKKWIDEKLEEFTPGSVDAFRYYFDSLEQ